MSDTSNPTLTPSPQTPLPNDAAARSATGEILEPAQIAAQTPPTTPEAPKLNPDGTPAQTSTPQTPEKPADGTKPPPAGAPETYTAFTAPEGYTLDPKTIEAATPIFKELGLSQEAAQKLVAFHSEQMIAAAKAPATEYETMRTAWQAKAKSDPDMAKAVNGDKTGLEAVKLDMGRALNAIGDPALASEFKAAMDLTGAGDHPAFIKTFWKLAQYVTEGKHVAGAQPSVHGQQAPGTTARPSAAQAMYPKLS
jgi:hypothetical protein